MALSKLAKLIASAGKEDSVEKEFLRLLDAATVNLEETRKPSKTFKPSSLGGCSRNVYFQVVGAELDDNISVEAPVIGMRDSGTDRHLRLQSIISRMKTLNYPVMWVDVGQYLAENPQPGTTVQEKRDYETKLYNSIFNMSFMCDGLISFKGKLYILEIKTESASKFNTRVAPAPKALVQAAAYAATIGVRDIMYVYENRDMMHKKTYHVHITDEDIENFVITPIETVNAHIEAQTVPPKTTDLKECRYCSYQRECAKW